MNELGNNKRRKQSGILDLWEQAISGVKTIQFGTRMVEAHTLTVLEKNYFKLVFDLLSQREYCVGFEFKLECKVVDDFDAWCEEKTMDFCNNIHPSHMKKCTTTSTTSSTAKCDLMQHDMEDKSELEKYCKLLLQLCPPTVTSKSHNKDWQCGTKKISFSNGFSCLISVVKFAQTQTQKESSQF